MSIEIHTSGPWFDGRAERAMQQACDDARDDVAQEGQRLVLNELGRVLRHPTGYYESRVTTDRVSADTSRVWDQSVVYGPWLEGVGSRNSPVTRFPGYGHWRRVKGILAGRARAIADRAVARHMSEMR